MTDVLRPHAEQQFAEELEVLRAADKRQRPENWRLSPWAVTTYVLGGKLADGFEISAKYFGDRCLIAIAVATLVTDRALLLLGVPGTAKTWVAEHLAAAIIGDSTLLIKGITQRQVGGACMVGCGACAGTGIRTCWWPYATGKQTRCRT